MENKRLEEIARFTQNEAKHLNRNSITSLIEQFIIEVEKLETLNFLLKERDSFLTCLEACGVDSWDGFEAAQSLYDEDE